jgi:hypothetical protein
VNHLTNTARLLTLLRLNLPQGQAGLLSVEVLLHVATGPKTAAELEVLTGAKNGPISRAIRTFIPWRRRSDGAVITPALPLLKRVKRPGRTAPVVFLSVMGWKVLRELELLPGPSKNGHR